MSFKADIMFKAELTAVIMDRRPPEWIKKKGSVFRVTDDVSQLPGTS